MLETTPATRDPLIYRLTSDVTVSADAGGVTFASPRGTFRLAGLSDAVHGLFADLQRTRTIDGEFEDGVLAADGPTGLSLLYTGIAQLARLAAIRFEVPGIATLVPIGTHLDWTWPAITPAMQLRLSRFAYVHRRGELLVLESPLARARIEFASDTAVAALAALARGATINEIAIAAGLSGDYAKALLALIAGGRFADTVSNGRLAEDRDATLRQWDFHDLLFHSRSRLGRHDEQMGGTYRFLSEIPPKPVVKAMHGRPYVELPVPDLGAIAQYDPSLLSVMEWRVSVRSDARQIITLEQLATFLYRVARLKARFAVGPYGEVSKRPYPSGGASYEIELYLNVDRCVGLAPGFYWYDPEQHRLYLVRNHDAETLAMLQLAHVATGAQVHPQVMITMAARFQRVAWKYAGMAYATILKNTGVLYATMYYVATAMGLAPCGMGLGDSDAFARVAGTDYYEETSVGEFILCGTS